MMITEKANKISPFKAQSTNTYPNEGLNQENKLIGSNRTKGNMNFFKDGAYKCNMNSFTICPVINIIMYEIKKERATPTAPNGPINTEFNITFDNPLVIIIAAFHIFFFAKATLRI